jgi:hypothetical protein
MYFLTYIILALTATLFLTNALRAWESIVLRIGEERASLPIYVLLGYKVPSTYAGNCSTRKHSTALLTPSLVALLVAIFLLAVVLLRFLIEWMLTHNPA